MASLKAVLCTLALTCALPLAAEIPVQPDFNYKNVEGVWHRVAMVLKGAEAEVVGAHIRIMPLTKGDLSVQKQIVIRRACRQVSSRFRHTNTPGQYYIFHSYNRKTTAHFVSTDYNSYLVLHIQSSSDTGLYLFARESEVMDTTLDTFQRQAESLGFSKRITLYPDVNVRCTF